MPGFWFGKAATYARKLSKVRLYTICSTPNGRDFCENEDVRKPLYMNIANRQRSKAKMGSHTILNVIFGSEVIQKLLPGSNKDWAITNSQASRSNKI